MNNQNHQETLELKTSGPDPMSFLVIDATASPIPNPWSIAGLIWAILHLLILDFGGDPNALLISSAVGLVVAIAASVSGVIDRPRLHPAGLPFLLFVVLLLFTFLFPGLSEIGSTVVRGWLLFCLGVLVPVWLLRDQAVLRTVLASLLLFSAVLALRSVILALPASWVLPRHHVESTVPLLAYRYGAYAAVQLLVVAAAIPWVIAGGKKVAYLAALPLALIVYSVVSLAFVLPEWLSDMAVTDTTWHVISPLHAYHPLALFLLLLALFNMGKVTLKERARWFEKGWRSGAMLGGWVAAMLTVLALFLLPYQAYHWVMTIGGFLVGIGLAARESLIREDETRHPRRRPTSIKGQIEELGIVFRSLGSALWRRLLFRTAKGEVPPPPRRIIDPASDRLHVPYEEGRPHWVPVVFHMHSNRWEGAFTPFEMVDHYARLGAGAVILTDHNRITDSGHTHGGILGYEHGWGPHHHHVLALGASRTRVEQYPFGGSLATRADTLERLQKTSRVLVLAHPSNGNGWSSEDVCALDYDALELFNKSIDDFGPWDDALTSGLLVWGTAGDDCHDLRSRHQTGKRYLLVDIREGSDPARQGAAKPWQVLEALKAGRFVAVRHLARSTSRALPDEELPMIEQFAWKADKLHVQFDRVVNYAEVIGPGGEVTSILKQVKTFILSPAKGQCYCRLVIYHGNHTLTLNPIARIHTKADPQAL